MNFAVDASICVSAFFPQEELFPEAWEFMQQVFAGVHQIVAPASVLTEVGCSASRRCERYKIRRSSVMRWITVLKVCKYISFKTIDLAFAHDAAHCGSIYRLKGMDALVGATAIYFDVPLIAEDRDFERMHPHVNVLKLRALQSFINTKRS